MAEIITKAEQEKKDPFKTDGQNYFQRKKVSNGRGLFHKIRDKPNQEIEYLAKYKKKH